MSDLFTLSGKHAIVTGGTRGIGLAIAKDFLNEGASVVVNGRDEAKAERTLAELDAGDRVCGCFEERGDLIGQVSRPRYSGSGGGIPFGPR